MEHGLHRYVSPLGDGRGLRIWESRRTAGAKDTGRIRSLRRRDPGNIRGRAPGGERSAARIAGRFPAAAQHLCGEDSALVSILGRRTKLPIEWASAERAADARARARLSAAL